MNIRSECICGGQKYGIELIYKVIDGKRINIPNMVAEFRKLGKENKLFCTCGCNANVTLVAGPKMLRTQHFRLKHGTGNGKCTYKEESEVSVNTKINLKCWIDSCLGLSYADTIPNVPINTICNVESKYELTYYVRKYGIGLSYIKKDVNINDVKLELLSKYFEERLVIFSDESNLTYGGQYPEYLKKILNVQGFCALVCLSDDGKYENTNIKIIYYEENYRGLWEYKEVINDNINEFQINIEGEFLYRGVGVKSTVEKHRNDYIAKQLKIKTDLETKIEKERLAREKRQELPKIQLEAQKEEESGNERISKKKENLSLEKLFYMYPKYKIIYDFFIIGCKYFIKDKKSVFHVKNKDFQIRPRRICIEEGKRKNYVLLRDSKKDRYIYPRWDSGSGYIEIEASEMSIEEIVSKLKDWCEKVE